MHGLADNSALNSTLYNYVELWQYDHQNILITATYCDVHTDVINQIFNSDVLLI